MEKNITAVVLQLIVSISIIGCSQLPDKKDAATDRQLMLVEYMQSIQVEKLRNLALDREAQSSEATNDFATMASQMERYLNLNRHIALLQNGYMKYRIPSTSMEPSLKVGDFVWVDTLAYAQSKPGRFDLIVFRHPQNPSTIHIKRVIGLPGDLVKVTDGIITVNGQYLDEDYISPFNNLDKRGGEFVVSKDGYFVLGDNRDHSNDSRWFGSVNKQLIKGKVKAIWFSYMPNDGIQANRIGLLRW